MDDTSQPSAQSNQSAEPIRDHLKTITPLHAIEQPKATPPVTRPAASQIYPTAPVDPTPLVTNKATPRVVAVDAPVPGPNIGEEWKPPKNLLKTILEAVFVVVLSALAGALFQQWYKLVYKIVPSTFSACGNATNDGLTFACHGTLLSDLFAAAVLFSLAAFITYNIFKKSHLLAYYYGGLFVALLFFFRTALVLEFVAIYKLRWLFTENSLIDGWLVPAAVAAVPTAIIYALQVLTGKLGKKILTGVFGVFLLASIAFMPSLVKSLVRQQTEAGTQEVSSQITETILNSDVRLHAPKNYDGPLKFAYVTALVDDPEIVPQYQFYYDLDEVSGSMVIATLYKGSDNNFNPPKDCGDGRPSSYEYKLTQAYPCDVLYTTPKGRTVYAHTDKATRQSKSGPGVFLVPFDDLLLSVATPFATKVDTDVMKEFIDSFEPLEGAEAEAFIKEHIIRS